MDDYQASELEALERILGDANEDPIRLSYALMRSITEKFSKEIGRGGFGVVYQGSVRNEMVAVKMISNAHDLSDNKFMDEINCLIRAKHKNIVRFLGYCSDTQGEVMEIDGKFIMAEIRKRLLCFEYVPNGNIQQYIEEKHHGDERHVGYKIIKGICEGLHYLHQQRITHLDLKPENVMLDAQMEPKITDFGLSRCLDKGQSQIITMNICGTRGYIAPEVINIGKITLKSDIYALGVMFVKLLTGQNYIDFDNWHKSLSMECPLVKSCIEIARICMEHDQDKRPTVGEILDKLNETESTMQGSSMYKVNHTAFPGTELLDVYPLKLSFRFKINRQISSTFSLINNTDFEVGFLIIPDCSDRYENAHLLIGNLTPMSTSAITLKMRAREEPLLPDLMDKLEVVMVVLSDDDYRVKARRLMSDYLHKHREMSDVCEGDVDINGDDLDMSDYKNLDYLALDLLKQIQELGAEVHRAMLTTVVVVVSDSDSKDDRTTMLMDTITTCGYDNCSIVSIEVHPTEPWILVLFGHKNFFHFIIWNWRNKRQIYNYNGTVFSAKFIARKQWFVVGGTRGSIFVHTCPSMKQVYEIRDHIDPDSDDSDEDETAQVTALAVHPTRSLLLSYGYNIVDHRCMKLWDWNQGWVCTQLFNVSKSKSLILQAEFNLRDTNSFATIDTDGMIKIWKIGNLNPINKLKAAPVGYCTYSTRIFFDYISDRHLITARPGQSTLHIRDFNTGKSVHTLSCDCETDDNTTNIVICHPTRPVVVTASSRAYRGNIHVWDSTTYRLKKTIDLDRCPIHIAFMGLTRLMVAYKFRLEIMDIELE